MPTKIHAKVTIEIATTCPECLMTRWQTGSVFNDAECAEAIEHILRVFYAWEDKCPICGYRNPNKVKEGKLHNHG